MFFDKERRVIPAQESTLADLPVWQGKDQKESDVLKKFQGCLLGGAAGDALGAPVEFIRRASIIARFGPQGIQNYAPAYGGIGTITDDTQMTLFTAEGLLEALAGMKPDKAPSVERSVGQAYLRWLLTQGQKPRMEIRRDSWLFRQDALHHQRAPGNTCISALIAMKHPEEFADNDSKGCGGVMRAAPAGLVAWALGSVRDVFETGCNLAALTHGHPTGILPAGVLAVLIQALVEGATLKEGLHVAKAILREKPQHEETLGALEAAERLAISALSPHEAIAQLGQAWVAEEALAISVYCALVAPTFREGVILSVNHDGDSDSTGSITGNLLGALYGVQAIPSEWLEPLELRDTITEMATDLYMSRYWNAGESGDAGANREIAEAVRQKYSG